MNKIIRFFPRIFFEAEIMLQYLIILIPLALITGPFLPDLIVVICNLLFLYIAFKHKLLIYFTNKISLSFFLYWLYLLISSLLSDNIILSLESSLFYFRFGILCLAISYCLNINNNFSKLFGFSLLSVFVFLNIDGYFQFFTGTNFFGQIYNSNRLSGVFGEEKILGSYLARLYPLLFGLMILNYKKSKFMIIFLMFVFISSDVLIYITGERTAFIILLISTLMLIVLINVWKILRIFTFSLSLCLIAFISFNFEKTMDRMIITTINETNILGDKINLISSAHEKLYVTSFNIFTDNPIIGIGPKMFRFVCNYDKYASDNSCASSPHNLYLQLLSETGILGFIPILLFFLYLNFKFLKHLALKIFKNKISLLDNNISYMIALYCSLFPIIPTGNIFHNWLSIVFYLPIGFLIHEYYKKEK